jgi:hypothetical protein
MIRHGPQPAHQRRFHPIRIGCEFGFPQRQIGELGQTRDMSGGGQGRWGHERDSCDDLRIKDLKDQQKSRSFVPHLTKRSTSPYRIRTPFDLQAG